jgi:hypothetical protein
MSPKGDQHEVVKTALLDRWYRTTPEGFLLRRRPFAFLPTPTSSGMSWHIRAQAA